MSEDQPLLAIKQLRFAYHRGSPVIDDLSAAARAGRLIAVIGPNAAGKTTLLRLMLGQLRPQRGHIRLSGQSIHRISPHQRAAWISYVPQRSHTSFAFTAAQVVAMGRYALPWERAALDEALVACDLMTLADRPFAELSVGQQQRVLLARAICQSWGEGRIVLLDEPVSAMDLAHVHRTMQGLREMAGRGLTLIVVIHDLNLAARYADDIWLMDRGKMVAADRWAKVLQPDVLESVYRVRIRRIGEAEITSGSESEAQVVTEARPVFDVQLPPAPEDR
jgi:iron complex transport system ATP-binding protein